MTKSYLLLVVLLLFTSYSVYCWGGDKVKLKDIETLTLVNGQYTNGRRSAGVPQIKCVGGGAGCYKWTPDTIQCYNKGSDGLDVQWECKSEMPIEYKFGAISVTCEGYDYPHDPYVLRGSCGLEYKLEYSGKASGSGSSYSQSKPYYQEESKSSFGGFLVTCGVVLFVVAILYTCINSNNNAPAGPGTRAGTAPPPPHAPGFRSDYYPDSNPGCSNSTTNAGMGSQGTAGSTGGGFWTGAATGGLLGYMMGRNGNTSGTTYQRTGFTDSNYGSAGSSFFSSPSSSTSSSSGTHTSSGYGGTKRR